MDINNTPYILLRNRKEFASASAAFTWHTEKQALMLAQNHPLRLPATHPEALDIWAATTPLAMDPFGQIARLNVGQTQVEYNSGRGFRVLQDERLNPLVAPAGVFTDLALGGDGRLAVPWSDGADQHGLLLFHLAKRWQTRTDLPVPPRRAWVDTDNQIWCIGENTLMLCAGEPLPLPYTPNEGRFEPVTINPHELRLVWQQPLPDAAWKALAICTDRQSVYVLCHHTDSEGENDGRQQILRRPRKGNATIEWAPFQLSAEIPFLIDLAPVASGRFAALAPKQEGDDDFEKRDCPVLELVESPDTAGGQARLIRERYPMLSLAIPRFVSSLDEQLRYLSVTDPENPETNPRPRELHALRRPQYPRQEETLLSSVLDAGEPQTLWHRVYLDAAIPHGCAIELAVQAVDSEADLDTADFIPQPDPLWNPLPSELPFASTLAKQKKGEKGLFEILLQRPSGPVRRINGRYLRVKLRFKSDGRHSPILHALRVYHPRFSYQEAYFPEMYRQELIFDRENPSGEANGADTRERFLAAFEGMLTPIEGRIAAADQLISPDAAPVENLAWLTELLGASLPGHWPRQRQRRLVRNTCLIQQWKGTLTGVNLALDIATDGGVKRGEIVALENFRLRRTMATILGIDMDDGDHPLTLGTGMSGNSLVGDSLILSETDARAFLALFAPELATKKEAEAVKAFFDQYSHQVTILLHGKGVNLRSIVEEALPEAMPAQIQWQILETEHPFVLGIAPLLAVDTFLETAPDFRRVKLDDTRLGKEGLLKNATAFSPWDINAKQEIWT